MTKIEFFVSCKTVSSEMINHDHIATLLFQSAAWLVFHKPENWIAQKRLIPWNCDKLDKCLTDPDILIIVGRLQTITFFNFIVYRSK